MKGEPSAPQCGFSAKIVKLIEKYLKREDYGYFDIFTDQEVRDGLNSGILCDRRWIRRNRVKRRSIIDWRHCDIDHSAGLCWRSTEFPKVISKNCNGCWAKVIRSRSERQIVQDRIQQLQLASDCD